MPGGDAAPDLRTAEPSSPGPEQARGQAASAPGSSAHRRPQGRSREVSPLPLRTVAIDRYLETIFCIAAEDEPVRPSRIAQWLGVKAPTVSIGLRRLRAGGWIQTELDRRVTLTAAGNDAAQAIVRRHRLAECWLTDLLGLDWASAHLEANRISPSLSDTVLDRLDVALGEPATCPHGHAVPGRTAPYGQLVALAHLCPGTAAAVRRISEIIEHESFELLRALAAAGVRTGVEVTIEAGGSPDEIILTVGDRQHAITLAPETARLIWVEVMGPSASSPTHL
jgi:DtxR family Mn-dependent transcriptional regulator